MVDRAFVNEAAQWAIETTPGTIVPANKTIRSMSIEIDVAGEGEVFRPDGHKWGQLVIPANAEWTTWALSGRPTYTEICYPFESIFGTAVVVASGTGWKRTYTIQDTVADSAKTLSVEKGSAVRAAKLAYGLITDWSLSFSRKNGVSLTGGGIGQLLSDGATLTSPTDVALIPIVGKELDFYIDPTSGALGTTKMLRAFLVDVGVSNKYGPVWPINSANPSFAGHVELVPGSTVTIRLEADAAGMAYLSQFRNGDTLFARLLATSSKEYDTALPYKLQYDTALGIKTISDYGRDEEGVTIVNFDCEFTKDSTWAKAVEVQIFNGITTL